METNEYYIFNIEKMMKELTGREDVYLSVYDLFMTITNMTYKPTELETYSVEKSDDIWTRLTTLEQFFHFNDRVITQKKEKGNSSTYIVEVKYPDEINVNLFEAEEDAKKHCENVMMEIIAELVMKESNFEFDRTENHFRIQADDEEHEVEAFYYLKEIKSPCSARKEQERV